MSSVSLFPILAVALLVGGIAGVVVLINGRLRGRGGRARTGGARYGSGGPQAGCPEGPGAAPVLAGATRVRNQPGRFDTNGIAGLDHFDGHSAGSPDGGYGRNAVEVRGCAAPGPPAGRPG